MTINPKSPRLVLTAVKRIRYNLPSDIHRQIGEYIKVLETDPNAYYTTTQVFDLLQEHGCAGNLFNELTAQEIIARNITTSLTERNISVDDQLLGVLYGGMQWEIEEEILPRHSEEVRIRSITMKAGGLSSGKSLKLKNFKLDFASLSTILAGFLLSGQDMLDKPKPFAIAAGILVIVGTLLNTITKEISQQEATVFWGFVTLIQNHGNKLSTERQLFSITNKERDHYGLEKLTTMQFRYSLTLLEQLGSIQRVNKNTWRVVESFSIKE